ncbi:MAG: ADP-glyceromanno-heptose 6-epimerase [Flavobacteriales bacterium]
MIVVTGAAGFIGSCLVSRLNEEGFYDIVAVDDHEGRPDKAPNLVGKSLEAKLDRNEFFDWLERNENQVQFIFHFGARTDTGETDEGIFQELNIDFSKKVWECCVRFGLPLVYASSAATYGKGEKGFRDEHRVVEELDPLNAYGRSKNTFDRWAVQQEDAPFFWAGLKFFNVFGPNEYHKGRMASVVLHAFEQIRETGKMKLFRSHHPDFKDGEQRRDFIYVKDVLDICIFLMHHRKDSGLYNVGTGTARTFWDLATATFRAMDREPDIEFIPTPEDLRPNYQYYTCAEMEKLRKIGYKRSFTSLEEGIDAYVRGYLRQGAYY